MIELENVTKLYQQIVAVQDLNLTIEDGEIMGIIGHNGAGKSTTLKMILGLVAPTSGQVKVMGRDMAKESTYIKQFVGYLPEESPLYENMTVTEYLTFFLVLTFSVVTFGILPLKRKRGGFAANCRDRQSR